MSVRVCTIYVSADVLYTAREHWGEVALCPAAVFLQQYVFLRLIKYHTQEIRSLGKEKKNGGKNSRRYTAEL